MTYDPEYVRAFYDAYGAYEWQRLEASAYGRLQAIIHGDFLDQYVRRSDRVLDAGCGPGRFTAHIARLGAKVTALDVSKAQLHLAEQTLRSERLIDRVEDFVLADIVDLAGIEEGYFDVTVCYGGALSYVQEKRRQAAQELLRVTRAGGILLLSVMSRLGSAVNLVRRPSMEVLTDPRGFGLWQVLKTGDLPGVPSRAVNMRHPPMHLYTSSEVRQMFEGCEVLALAGSNVTAYEGSPALEEIAANPVAWQSAIALERSLNQAQGLVDNGTHIIMAVRRP
jgi:SAM-dependent methyltransferase